MIAQIPILAVKISMRRAKRTRGVRRNWGGMDVRARARLVNRLADAFEENLDCAVSAGNAEQWPPVE